MRTSKPQSLLTDIAEYHGTWQLRMWPIHVGSNKQRIYTRVYIKSTMGHYYHNYWHPLAVGQDTYVMDDFGNLYLVYSG